jgi:hypothetical protein
METNDNSPQPDVNGQPFLSMTEEQIGEQAKLFVNATMTARVLQQMVSLLNDQVGHCHRAGVLVKFTIASASEFTVLGDRQLLTVETTIPLNGQGEIAT